MSKLTYQVGIYFTLLFLACANAPMKTELIQAPINPNGDSELAILMREMFEDGMAIKSDIKNGIKPKGLNKFTEIHSAKATEPEKTASKEYKIFADDYIKKIESLEAAEGEDIQTMYQAMVQSCMNCHQAMCPGPMVKVRKMFLN